MIINVEIETLPMIHTVDAGHDTSWHYYHGCLLSASDKIKVGRNLLLFNIFNKKFIESNRIVSHGLSIIRKSCLVWACHCQVQICNWQCHIIDETNIRVLLVCHCQLQVCITNEALYTFITSLHEGGMWEGGSGERERYFCFWPSLMYFLKIFGGVGCWMSV